MIKLSDYKPIIYPFGVIYGLRSPSGKWYVGQTRQNIFNYIKYTYSKSSKRLKQRRAIYNAIIKYTFEKFDVFILHECDSLENLNKKETEIINYYDSVNIGYNCNSGGDSQSPSEETKKRMSVANKGKKMHSNEFKDFMRQRMLGRKVSEETRKKMSDSRLGKKTSDKLRELFTKTSCKWVCTIKDFKGILYTNIDNLSLFCKDHNLSYSNMIREPYKCKGYVIISMKNIKTGEVKIKDLLNTKIDEELISGIIPSRENSCPKPGSLASPVHFLLNIDLSMPQSYQIALSI